MTLSMRLTTEVGSQSEFQRYNILWLRWLGRDASYPSGRSARRLHKIGFVEDVDDATPFGFIDPKDIIRGVHLIPSFADGRSPYLLSSPSFTQDGQGDWMYFYVNQ